MLCDKTERLYTSINIINRKLRIPKFDFPNQNVSVTKVQWWILKVLMELEQCSAGDLAKIIGVRPATMSQMLERLEKSKFIIRCTDDSDGRVRIISLTDKGRRMFYESESKFIEKLDGPFACLSPQEQEILAMLMNKLCEHFP